MIRNAYTDLSARTKAIAAWTGAGGIAIAAGPVIGGVLTSGLGWRAIFFVNVPVGIISFLFLRGAKDVVGPLSKKRHFDIAGQLAIFLFIVGATFGLIEAGVRGWSSLFVIASGVIAVLALITFIFIEQRSKTPLVRLSLFRSADVSSVITTGFVLNLSFYGLVFVFSLLFQEILGKSPLIAGLMFVPMMGMVAISNLFSGRLINRFGPRLPLVSGQIILAVGFLAFLLVDRHTNLVLLLLLLVPFGIGAGLATPPMTTALLEAIPQENAGIAAAVLNACRQLGGAVGVALFGILLAGRAGFVVGMHRALLVSAVIVALTAVLTFVFVKVPHPEPLHTK